MSAGYFRGDSVVISEIIVGCHTQLCAKSRTSVRASGSPAETWTQHQLFPRGDWSPPQSSSRPESSDAVSRGVSERTQRRHISGVLHKATATLSTAVLTAIPNIEPDL